MSWQAEKEKRLRELGATEDETLMLMDGGLAAYNAAIRLAERAEARDCCALCKSF